MPYTEEKRKEYRRQYEQKQCNIEHKRRYMEQYRKKQCNIERRRRYRNNPRRKEYMKQYLKRYHEKYLSIPSNKEQKSKRGKQYYYDNKEKVAEKCRNWFKQNKKYALRRSYKYRKEHKENYSAYAKKYRTQKIYTLETFLSRKVWHICHRDKKLGRRCDIDAPYLLALYKSQNGCCAATGLTMTHTYGDHKSVSIDRIDSNGFHVRDNCQLVIKFYNFGKGYRSDINGRALLEEMRMNTLNSLENSQTNEVPKAFEVDNFKNFLNKKLKSAKQEDVKYNRENDIDLPYVIDLLKSQNGRCAATGVIMTPTWGDLKSASIDRIDNARGHIKGNVQIVSTFYNIGKSKFSDTECRELMQELRLHWIEEFRKTFSE
jgi:hypothetical protein